MNVLVFGAGSLGSLLGGLLARAHDVTLVGRDPHVGAVRESGLAVEGVVSATVRPTAVTAIPEADGETTATSDERESENENGSESESGSGHFDLAVVTVKAFDTAAAADALAAADAEVGAALSLSNGLGNEETLAAELPCPVLAGTCTYGARLVEPGRVECTGVGEVTLGPREGIANDADGSPARDDPMTLAERVGDAFRAAGVETTVARNMPRRLWEKLAVNAGINAVTALARVENGALVEGPARETAREAARETARVAREHGVGLTDDEAAAAVTDVAAATARNRSSMRQDVERGTRTEVDAINGAVADRASDPVPVNETLAALVRAWERERGLREG